MSYYNFYPSQDDFYFYASLALENLLKASPTYVIETGGNLLVQPVDGEFIEGDFSTETGVAFSSLSTDYEVATLLALGDLFLHNQQFDEGIEFFVTNFEYYGQTNPVITDQPIEPVLFLQLGRLHLAKGEYEAAEQYFTTAISYRDDPGASATVLADTRDQAMYQLTLRALDNYNYPNLPLARTRLDLFSESVSDSLLQYTLQARILLHEANYDDAIALLQSRHDQAGCNLDCKSVLGQAYLQRYLGTGIDQDLTLAITILESAQASQPLNSEIPLTLATAYKISGEFEQAFTTWQRGLFLTEVDMMVPPLVATFLADRYQQAMKDQGLHVTAYSY